MFDIHSLSIQNLLSTPVIPGDKGSIPDMKINSTDTENVPISAPKATNTENESAVSSKATVFVTPPTSPLQHERKARDFSKGENNVRSMYILFFRFVLTCCAEFPCETDSK